MRRRHPYTWGRDHPLVVDGILAVALAVAGVATEAAGRTYSWERHPDDFSGLLTLATSLPLVLRRRRPLAVCLVILGGALVYYAMAYPGGGPLFGLVVAVYGVSAYVSRRAALWCIAAVVLAVGGGHLLEEDGQEGSTGWDVVVIGAVMTTAAVLGDNMRVRRSYVAAVEDRAVQLEREQDAQARRAVLEERARIARELHDVVAHSMSVMVVQAGAARRTLERDPARAAEAIGQIESTGRGALSEMRRLVGVLRSDPDPRPDRPDQAAQPDRTDPTAGASVGEAGELPLLGGNAGGGAALGPQPGIDQVPALVDQCREVGLDVDLRVTGPERPLPSGVELVVYRIVQEALTNTLRHAGPARAEVELAYAATSIAVTVTDDGRGAAAGSGPGAHSPGRSDQHTPRPGDRAQTALIAVPGRSPTRIALLSGSGHTGTGSGTGPGHGLTGMHERVSLYGGQVTAGPRRGGGFRVWAEIPLPDADSDSDSGSGSGERRETSSDGPAGGADPDSGSDGGPDGTVAGDRAGDAGDADEGDGA